MSIFSSSHFFSLSFFQQALTKAVGGKNLGFNSKGHPVAAALLFRCLQHWGAFEGSGKSVFDCVVNSIKVVEKATDSQVLVYWLSSTVNLYRLVQLEEEIIATGQSPLSDKFRARTNEYFFDTFKHSLENCIRLQYELIRSNTRAKLMTLLGGGDHSVRKIPFFPF